MLKFPIFDRDQVSEILFDILSILLETKKHFVA